MYVSDKARVLLAALDALPDPAWCEGRTVVAAPIELAIPGSGLRALDADDLEDWLIAHSEAAPFGDLTGTRHDPSVRDTRRVTARAETVIRHFEPSAILGEIEHLLATDCRLAAELLDVLVYTRGSKFLPHKDTPRHDDQLGTLVVELPRAHHGGALLLTDGDHTATIDWSGDVAPRAVRWVAMFGDVDHEITPITEGMRIAAVYTVRYRTDERLPENRAQMDTVIDAAIALHDDCYDDQLIAIPCGRMIVAPREDRRTLTHTVLRGADRLIAAALARAGITVTVREGIAVALDADQSFEEGIDEAGDSQRIVLLNRALPDGLIARSDAISWHVDPQTEQGYAIAAVAPYIDEAAVPRFSLLARKHLRIPGKEMWWSRTGYFGNEYSGYYVYLFAMMLAEIPMDPSRW